MYGIHILPFFKLAASQLFYYYHHNDVGGSIRKKRRRGTKSPRVITGTRLEIELLRYCIMHMH